MTWTGSAFRWSPGSPHWDHLLWHPRFGDVPRYATAAGADRAYIDALRRGEEPADARLDADWISGPHQSNLEQAL